jgi:hypothetical protein
MNSCNFCIRVSVSSFKRGLVGYGLRSFIEIRLNGVAYLVYEFLRFPVFPLSRSSSGRKIRFVKGGRDEVCLCGLLPTSSILFNIGEFIISSYPEAYITRLPS